MSNASVKITAHAHITYTIEAQFGSSRLSANNIVATAIMLANIGDEQGLDASAKKVPTRKGYKNKLPFLF